MNIVDRLIVPVMGHRPITNRDLYRAVRRRANRNQIRLSRCWKATIRNTLQRHAKGHPKCGPRVLFIQLDRATWILR